MTKGRYASLDAIRGLSALGVMLFHYRAHFGAAPFETLLAPVYASGMYLVDVFFVLSGYLLATIYAGRRDFAVLAWKRVARLLPLHWAMLAAVAILQFFHVAVHGRPFIYVANDSYHFLLNLLMLNSSGLQENFSFDGPSWSISVEWMVNLLLFLAMATGAKRLPGLAAGVALLAAWALWAHMGHLLAYGNFMGWIDANLLRGAAGFFAGVALTGLVPLTLAPRRMARHAWDAVLVLAACGLLAFMALEAIRDMPGADFVLVLVVVPMLVCSSVHGYWSEKLLALPPLQWLGRISFSIYLLHFPMQLAFVLLSGRGGSLEYGLLPTFFGYVVATLGAAFLAWKFIELPAQAWMNGRLRTVATTDD